MPPPRKQQQQAPLAGKGQQVPQTPQPVPPGGQVLPSKKRIKAPGYQQAAAPGAAKQAPTPTPSGSSAKDKDKDYEKGTEALTNVIMGAITGDRLLSRKTRQGIVEGAKQMTGLNINVNESLKSAAKAGMNKVAAVMGMNQVPNTPTPQNAAQKMGNAAAKNQQAAGNKLMAKPIGFAPQVKPPSPQRRGHGGILP